MASTNGASANYSPNLKLDEAREFVGELRQLLADDCMHYGSVHRKFNGGRMSLYCNWCSTHIGDKSEGQMRVPMNLRDQNE